MGAYCGYSAIRIARLLPEGALLISIEKSALFAVISIFILNSFKAISTKMVELAGLSSKVKILIGTAENWIPKLKQRFNFENVDLIFIDHWKDRYLPDLKIIEASGILKEGTVIVADNVLFPGTPDYLDYVRKCGHYDTKLHKSTLEYNPNVEDGVEVSIYKPKTESTSEKS